METKLLGLLGLFNHLLIYLFNVVWGGGLAVLGEDGRIAIRPNIWNCFFTDHRIWLDCTCKFVLQFRGVLQYAPTFGTAIIAENDLNYYDLVGKDDFVKTALSRVWTPPLFFFFEKVIGEIWPEFNLSILSNQEFPFSIWANY